MYRHVIYSLVNILSMDAYTNQEINNSIKKYNLVDNDKELYTMLVYGVVENKLLLDYELKPFLKARVKPFIKNSLRVGIYALNYTSLKDHFVVNEIVAVVKKVDYKGSKLVNAVLRNYIRSGKKIDLDSIIDESVKYSIDPSLVKIIKVDYPNNPDLIKNLVCPKKTNTYIINPLIKMDHQFKIDYSLNKKLGFIKSDTSLINTDYFKKGLLIPQDLSSMMSAITLNPEPNDVVLDCCSAPGTKSIDMAILMENKGMIISCDIYDHKLDLINNNTKKYQVSIINTMLADGRNFKYPYQFDKILVDAPCSGLGVINHKPDLKYKLNMDKIHELANLSYSILDNASKYLKDNGTIVYSTCTITKCENEDNIAKFLENHANFEKISEEVILPNENQDGFYICKLKKVK